MGLVGMRASNRQVNVEQSNEGSEESAHQPLPHGRGSLKAAPHPLPDGRGSLKAGVERSAFIALGSNLGDRAGHLRRALALLGGTPGVRVVAVSSFHETDPVGDADQPRFLNAAAHLATSRSPRDLLEVLLGVERELGRVRRPAERWGPRTIDLDLLLMGDLVVEEPGLTLPHPRMHERAFVLEPLAEIAAGVVHPVLKRSIGVLRDEARRRGCCSQP